MTDREIADETAKLRTLVHEAQGARFKDRIMLVGMLDAAAKTIRSQCYDHVDNCCSDWCDMCKTGERLRDEWIGRHSIT